MKEIYWIQRIGAISTTTTILAIISGIFVGIILIAYFIYSAVAEDESDFKVLQRLKKGLVALSISFVCFLIPAIFVPSENDLYVIYGVGGTIDYLKENDTAKQLPDKTVQCLDKWMESYLNDKKDNNQTANEEK